MKRSLLLLLIIVLGLISVSCTENIRFFNSLNEIVKEHPDSVLQKLDSISFSSLKYAKEKAQYALLKSEALDRCLIDVTDDSLILYAYQYYAERKVSLEKLKATYYLGVVHHNANHYSDAAINFTDAEDLAQKMNDYHHLGLIYWHLSRIYSATFDHNLAVTYMEQSVEAYRLAEEEFAMDYSMFYLVQPYKATGRVDDAFRITDYLLNKYSIDKSLYRNSLKHKAELLMSIKPMDYTAALTCYDEAFRHRGTKMTNIDLCHLAVLYEYSGDRDASGHYLSALQARMNSATDSALYYNTLYNIYDHQQLFEQASGALVQALRIQDREITRLTSVAVSHALSIHSREVLALQKKQTQIRVYRLVLIILVLLFSFAVITRRIIVRNKRIREEMATVLEISDELNKSFVNDKVNTLKSLSDSYFSWDDAAIRQREKNNGIDTRDELVYSFRHQLASLRNDLSFISLLEKNLNTTQDNVVEHIRERFRDDFSADDYNIIILSLSGFTIKAIRFLLNRSEASVRMRRSRLSAILHDAGFRL